MINAIKKLALMWWLWWRDSDSGGDGRTSAWLDASPGMPNASVSPPSYARGRCWFDVRRKRAALLPSNPLTIFLTLYSFADPEKYIKYFFTFFLLPIPWALMTFHEALGSYSAATFLKYGKPVFKSMVQNCCHLFSCSRPPAMQLIFILLLPFLFLAFQIGSCKLAW